MTRWRSLALALLSVLVFAGLFEGIVRLLSPDLTLPAATERFRFDQTATADRPTHVRDDRLGWRLAPNQSESMSTNSRGFRCDDFDDEKAPGVYRIVFAGDSNPLGFAIEDDVAPYPERVEHLLNRFYAPVAGHRFEVINLAVDGYSSHQVKLLLEEWVPRLEPDLLCVQVAFNDYCVAVQSDAEKRFSRPALLDALERSHAYRWLRRTLLSIIGRRGKLENPVPRVAPDRYAENVTDIVRTAEEVGTEVILLTTPACFFVPLVVNEVELEENGRSRWVSQDRWIKERLVAAGVTPPEQPDHPLYSDVVRRAIEQHPTWPSLPYMLSLAAAARGELAEAAVYEQRWRQLDSERAVLARYAAALREVGQGTGARVIDVGETLRSYLDEREANAPGGLFIDFVHLDPVGHVVVATEITRVIVEEVLELRAGINLSP